MIIFWDTSARGYKLFDSGADDSVSNLVTSANADYNCGHNVLAGDGKGYNNLEFSSGSPGANDVDEDPNFVDSSRDLLSWGATLGASNLSETLAELAKLNDPDAAPNSGPTDLLEWVKAGFAPQNTAFQGAGKDGVDIGAIEVQVAASENASGLSMLGIG